MNLSEIAINIGKRPKLIEPKFINKNFNPNKSRYIYIILKGFIFNGKTTQESIPRKK